MGIITETDLNLLESNLTISSMIINNNTRIQCSLDEHNFTLTDEATVSCYTVITPAICLLTYQSLVESKESYSTPPDGDHSQTSSGKLIQIPQSLTGRRVYCTTPDGNCFFRGASIIFSGSENNHLHIRHCLVCFTAANARIFSPLVMQYSDLDAHIKTVMQHFVHGQPNWKQQHWQHTFGCLFTFSSNVLVSGNVISHFPTFNSALRKG